MRFNRIRPFVIWQWGQRNGPMSIEAHNKAGIDPESDISANNPSLAAANQSLLASLAIQYRQTTSLTPHKRNARTHSRKQIRQIADSIKTFGFTNPVLIDSDSGIVAGHGRVEAAKYLGMITVPTVLLERMNEAQRRAYAIADNRLAELAGWDQALLKIELGELSIEFPEMDLTVTGFETAELDLILLGDGSGAIASDSKADEIPSVGVGPTVSRLGDLWQLGPHRLFCGDARDQDSYLRLLGDERARLVLTDPPYNVRIAGHARGLGCEQHADFVMAAGEMTEPEFTSFLDTAFQQMNAFSVPGAVHFTFMDWRHLREALSAGYKTYDALLNICTWVKGIPASTWWRTQS
jgi:hypothetical protein